MQSIADILKAKVTSTHKTNRFWLISEQIASLTDTKPTRWLRVVKQHEHACLRAIDDLKEIPARNPVALFLWLLKRYR